MCQEITKSSWNLQLQDKNSSKDGHTLDVYPAWGYPPTMFHTVGVDHPVGKNVSHLSAITNILLRFYLNESNYFCLLWLLTWKTVSKALMIESKLDVGVPSGKLSWPPKNCIPNRAKMKMNRKSSRSRDMIDDKAFIRAITRFLNGDQYLKKEGLSYRVCKVLVIAKGLEWPTSINLRFILMIL